MDMPRKNKPVPGHTTLIISSPDEGQLDDASQSQLLEMMKLEDSDAQGALLSDLASWGHNAYRLYKQDEVTLPKKVVKSTLQEVNQAAEHLGQLLTQLDTQSEGELVVAYAALKDSLSTRYCKYFLIQCSCAFYDPNHASRYHPSFYPTIWITQIESFA